MGESECDSTAALAELFDSENIAAVFRKCSGSFRNANLCMGSCYAPVYLWGCNKAVLGPLKIKGTRTQVQTTT